MVKPRKFKTIKHYHEPGDLHELTFSCYRQIKLLTNDAWRGYLARSIDEAGEQFRFQLVAFVFMPEHVHLLVFPLEKEPSIDRYLAAIKRPVSADVKRDLQCAGSPLIKRLTIRERPDKEVFRFWQEGPGYDRNSQKPATVLTAGLGLTQKSLVGRRIAGQIVVAPIRHWRHASATPPASIIST